MDNRHTDWFSVYSGVLQGDNLAPTLFAIYENDVTTCINLLNVGVPFSETDSISILLYADDIVLMAQNAEDLQKMMNALHELTIKWRLSVNTENTQVMHVRKHQTRRTDYTFRLGDNLLRFTETYRYLGLDINEFIHFSHCASVLHDAGSRALGVLISTHTSKGLDFTVYEKIFKSTVVPVMDYSAGLWGYKQFDSHDKLQLKAIRTFLGVGKHTPLVALDGDVGWDSPKLRLHVDMIRLWCRLVKMDHDRLPFKVLKYDIKTSVCVGNTWAREIRNILKQCNMLDYYDIDVSAAPSTNFVANKVCTELQQNLFSQLATRFRDVSKIANILYKTYKIQTGTEKYLFRHMSIKQRSYYTKFRCGTFPINIELGRYRNPKVPAENRLCKGCENPAVEDEKHFLVECSGYNNPTNEIFNNLNIHYLTDDEKKLNLV